MIFFKYHWYNGTKKIKILFATVATALTEQGSEALFKDTKVSNRHYKNMIDLLKFWYVTGNGWKGMILGC